MTTNNMVEEEGLNIVAILSSFLSHWKLFVISIVVCLALAAVHLYFAVPQYRVTSKILLSDKEKGSFNSQADMLVDFGYQMGNSNVENEIEVINSMSVARGAVLTSGVYVSYKRLGIKESPIYRKSSPVNVEVTPEFLSSMAAPINIFFTYDGNNPVKVRYSYINEGLGINVETGDVEIKSFPYVLKTVAGDVFVKDMRVQRESENEEGNAYNCEIQVTINQLESTARNYMSRLAVAPVSKTSSVAVIAINTPVPAEGVDYLNAVIESYNNVTNEDKRQVARKTEEFLNSRLFLLRQELSEKEGHLARYKKDKQLIDPKLDASQVMQKRSEYVKQLEELDMLIESSKYLNNFVNNPSNDMKAIPTTFGMTIDQSLLTLINTYNREVAERNRLLLTASEDNPILRNVTLKVRSMQEELRVALNALGKSLGMQREAISMLLGNYTDRFEMSPEIERELLALERECGIKSDLYVMLLQKFEENALSLAVTADNLRCIDAPTIGGAVSPNSRMTILIALFLGLAIPAVYVYLRMMLQTKLTSVEDIAKDLVVPHIGTTPVLENFKGGRDTIVVRKNVNDVVAESFRTVRTNLQFVMKNTSGKVVMLTSTTSGEGKTFIAANMAASMALLGKKVLLVGADIRRPRLAEVFGFGSNVEGLTSYLFADSKDVSILDKNIIKSEQVEGLDILPAGIVPPNPAELLAGSNLDCAIEYFKTKYDFIVIDSAPVGLVSDSMLINRVADSVVYVLRINYSHKEDIAFMNHLLAEGKLTNVSVLVNGENLKRKLYKSGRFGSRRYAGYGYTVTTGYGNNKGDKAK